MFLPSLSSVRSFSDRPLSDCCGSGRLWVGSGRLAASSSGFTSCRPATAPESTVIKTNSNGDSIGLQSSMAACKQEPLQFVVLIYRAATRVTFSTQKQNGRRPAQLPRFCRVEEPHGSCRAGSGAAAVRCERGLYTWRGVTVAVSCGGDVNAVSDDRICVLARRDVDGGEVVRGRSTAGIASNHGEARGWFGLVLDNSVFLYITV